MSTLSMRLSWTAPWFAALSILACGAPPSDGGDGGDSDSADGTLDCPNKDPLTGACKTDPASTRATCESSQVGPRLLRRLTKEETDATLRDVFPELTSVGWTGTKLSADNASALGFSTDASTLVVGEVTAKGLQQTAEEVAALLTGDELLPTFQACALSAPDTACATDFIQRVGRRLFRRALSDAEMKLYVDYQASVAGRSDFVTGLKWALSTMIQSPRTFYRSELGAEADGAYQLTQLELASELAYVFTGSTPDEALLATAEAGGLTDAAKLRQEAVRLMATERGRDQMHRFFLEWLGYAGVSGKVRNEDMTFAAEVSPLMVSETEGFIQEVVFSENGSFERLMTADFTSLNDRLSTFYGYGGLTSPEFARVTRPPTAGTGILAQGSLLVKTAHEEETSPTLRGLLFYTKFLCNPRPIPPAVVPPLAQTTEAFPDAKTTREKYEIAHTEQAACKSCHISFDPYGFAFEQFDELGRYRADEDGNPINTVADVTLPDATQTTIDGLPGLISLLEGRDDIENCVSGLMAAFFLSGAGGQNCLAEDQRRAFAKGELSIADYVLGLVDAPHFTSRQ